MPAPDHEDTLAAEVSARRRPGAAPCLAPDADLLDEARIRREAISLHRSFAPVRSLLGETELLALNASVACSRLGAAGRTFATVARELHSSSATLRLRIDDVESAFFHIAARVARWSRLDQTLRHHQRGIAAVQAARGESLATPWGRAWAPETRRRWAQAARGAEAPMERRLWTVLLECREQLTTTISELHQLTVALERLMDRIRWAAVRQTRYLAVLANIEQAHLHDQGQAVEAVVRAMAQLDERLAALERSARDKVDRLQTSMDRLARAMWPSRRPRSGSAPRPALLEQS
jgi:hypothetical protein